MHKVITSATGRLTLSIVIGFLVGVVTWLLIGPAMGLLTGITGSALAFVVVGTLALWPMGAQETARHARQEDFSPIVDEIVVASAASGGLIGIVVLLVHGGTSVSPWAAAVALLGVLATWATLHLMYLARYAHMYYAGERRGGIDFNTQVPPPYSDFFYFSFAVGMTYGITDTTVANSEIRAVVLRHSLLSFVFGTAVVATAINLVVGAFGG